MTKLPGLDSLIYDLPSLQLSNALQPSEACYLPIRQQNKCFLNSALAQCRYFMHTRRQLAGHFVQLKKSKSISSTTSKTKVSISETESHFKVGIIGCGRVGQHLLESFIHDSNISIKNILVSTRQPEKLQHYSTSHGVTCLYNNALVASSVDVIFLACLPSQLNYILQDIATCLFRPGVLIVSLLAGISVVRLNRLLPKHVSVVKICFEWRNISIELRATLSETANSRQYGVMMTSRKLCTASCPLSWMREAGDSTVQWWGELLVASLLYTLLLANTPATACHAITSVLINNNTDASKLIDSSILEETVSTLLDKMHDANTRTDLCVKWGTVLFSSVDSVANAISKFVEIVSERELSLMDIAKATSQVKIE